MHILMYTLTHLNVTYETSRNVSAKEIVVILYCLGDNKMKKVHVKHWHMAFPDWCWNHRIGMATHRHRALTVLIIIYLWDYFSGRTIKLRALCMIEQ